MATKITIIGAGSVGATMAYTLSLETLATEIVLIDINNKKADGEALDILQSTAYRDPIDIKAGTYQNPVDILTYVFMKESGIPESQIIGSGTQLDTARLRSLLAEELSISQKNVHAYIFGEHGDSSFVPWSVAHIAGIPIPEYYEVYNPNPQYKYDEAHIIDYVRKSGSLVIAEKGATFYAVTVAVIKLCRILLSSDNAVTTVSTMLHGEYGIRDVCLSISCMIGPKGVSKRIQLHLTDEEIAKLQASVAKLRELLDQIYAD